MNLTISISQLTEKQLWSNYHLIGLSNKLLYSAQSSGSLAQKSSKRQPNSALSSPTPTIAIFYGNCIEPKTWKLFYQYFPEIQTKIECATLSADESQIGILTRNSAGRQFVTVDLKTRAYRFGTIDCDFDLRGLKGTFMGWLAVSTRSAGSFARKQETIYEISGNSASVFTRTPECLSTNNDLCAISSNSIFFIPDVNSNPKLFILMLRGSRKWFTYRYGSLKPFPAGLKQLSSENDEFFMVFNSMGPGEPIHQVYKLVLGASVYILEFVGSFEKIEHLGLLADGKYFQLVTSVPQKLYLNVTFLTIPTLRELVLTFLQKRFGKTESFELKSVAQSFTHYALNCDILSTDLIKMHKN